VIDVIDRARRNCLWRKRKDDEKVHSLASWDMICKPKNKGGLGIINLKIQTKCLMMKQLHKFYNNVDLPWVKLIRNSYYYKEAPHAITVCGSFWWRNIMKMFELYRQVTHCKIGSGETILFWSDNWNDGVIDDIFPDSPLLQRTNSFQLKRHYKLLILHRLFICLYQLRLLQS
jgi:hypothetical protein